MNLNLGNTSLTIILLLWVTVLVSVSTLVVSAENYMEPIYEYDSGGQIVNVTMFEGEYIYIYYTNIPEEGYGTGKHSQKVVIGDIFVKYKAKDNIDVPILYSPREWTELRLNWDNIIESDEPHKPLNNLISLYVAQGVIIFGVLFYHGIKKYKPKNS